jgi:hypothetical protein
MRRWIFLLGFLSLLGSGRATAAARWGDLLCYDFVVEGRITDSANWREGSCGDDFPGCYAWEALIRSDKVVAGRSAPDKFWATTVMQTMPMSRSRLFLFVARDDDGRYYVIDANTAGSDDFDVAGRPELKKISRAVVCPKA